jgi:hypothetical protein
VSKEHESNQINQIKSINQFINQIHSHHPSHAHQLHIAQPGIAPSPNNRSLMHGGAQSNHSERASVRVSKEHESNQSINLSINQINQIHPLYLVHLHPHQLHIPQADIAPLPNVHKLPSRLAYNHPANIPIPHIQLTCSNDNQITWCWNSREFGKQI